MSPSGLTTFILLIYVYYTQDNVRAHINGINKNTSVILEDLFHFYKTTVPPFDITGEPLSVKVNTEIRGLSSISDVSMDYVFRGYIRLTWRDTRLDYSHHATDKGQYIVLDPVSSNLIWRPEIYIPNAKGSTNYPFSFTWLYTNGTIFTSNSYSIPLSCLMNLHKYPMDNQTCPLYIESFSYSETQLKFVWEDHNPIQVDITEVTTPQFYMKGYKTSDCRFRSVSGTFSCLKLHLMLQRSIGFHLIQTFIPTVLIVMVSWINFWINHQATPARVALGVTCVLTMVTQSAAVRNGLPEVSYIKAIDVWMTSCLIFVFAALFEYAIVNVLARKEVPFYFEVADENPKVGKNQNLIKGPNGKMFIKEYVPVVNRDREARSIESLARRVFPLSFLGFNIVYWTVYLYVW